MHLCGIGNANVHFISKKMGGFLLRKHEEPAVGFACRLHFAVQVLQSSDVPARGSAIAARKKMVRKEHEVRWDLFCKLCITKGL